MRPRSIVRFERLYIVKIGLGVIATLWGLSGLRHVAPGMATILSSPQAVAALIVGLAGALAIELLLLYLVVQRASDVARWIIVLFFAGSSIALLFGGVKGSFFSWGSFPVSLLAFAASAGAIWFLFRPDAGRWFRVGRPRRSTILPGPRKGVR